MANISVPTDGEQPTGADGKALYQQMLDGGMPALQVEGWKQGLKAKMLDGGMPADQVNTYWGDHAPDLSDVNNQVQANLKPYQHLASSPTDYLNAGWQNSALSLGAHAPTVVKGQDGGFGNNLLFDAGQMVGDVPASVEGAIVGAVGGEAVNPSGGGFLGAAFGSGAWPEAMREVMLNHYNNPSGPFSWKDLLSQTAQVAWSSTKAGLTNAAGGAVGGAIGGAVAEQLGKVAGPGLTAVGRSVAEMTGWAAASTTVGDAWEGKIPDAQDFGIGAISALGMAAAGHMVGAGANQRFQFTNAGKAIVQHLQQIYQRTGLSPQEALAEAIKDPATMNEIFHGTDADGNSATPSLDGVAASQGNRMSHDNAPIKSNFEPLLPPEPAKPAAEGAPAEETIPPPGRMTPEAVPETMVEGVRRLEDSADDAVSTKGAIGRMQIIPTTARQYGFDPSLLKDPAYNERAGRAILSDLYNHFNGNMQDILVAYNAGRSRADRWVAEGRPFNDLPLQTQNYLLRAERFGITDTNYQHGVADQELANQNWDDPSRLPHSKPVEPDAESTDPDQIIQEINNKVAPIPTREKPNLGTTFGNAFRSLQTELAPATSLDKDLFDDRREIDTEDMFRLMNYGVNSVAERWVSEGAVHVTKDETGAPAFVTEKGTALKDAFAAVREDGGTAEGFQAYLLASRISEKAEQGVELGFDPDRMNALIDNPAVRKAYARGAAIWQANSDARAQFMADTGLYSQKRVDAMKDFNRTYVPMRRLIDKDAPPPVPGRTWGLKQPTKVMAGTKKDLPILDPMAVQADNIRLQTAMGVRNLFRQQLLEKLLAANREGAKFPIALSKLSKDVVVAEVKRAQAALAGEKITDENGLQLPDEVRDLMEPFVNAKEIYDGLRKSGHMEPGEHPFMLFRKGEPEVWKTTDPRLAKLFDRSPGMPDDPIMNIAAAFNRRAVTGISAVPSFFITSAIHAAFGMAGLSEGTIKSIQFPLQALFEGTLDGIMGGKAWDEYKTNGGGYSAWSDINTNYMSADQNQMFEKTGTTMAIYNTVRHPVEGMRLLQHATHTAMQVGRYKALRRDGFPIVKSAMLARKAGLDYAEQRSGAFANMLARNVPFMSTGMKDIDQFVSALTPQRIGVTALAATVAYILPTVINFALNMQADQYLDPKDRWGNVPRYIRDSTFVLPPINGVRLKFPKPYVAGFFFSTLIEHGLEAMYDQAQGNPEAKRALDTAFDNMLNRTVPQAYPTIINPFLEQATNHNFLTGRPLIPDHLAGLQGWLQYSPSTSDTSKMIARWLGPVGPMAAYGGVNVNIFGINPSNSSGIVIDNYIRKWGGTAATTFWEELGNLASGGSTFEKPGSRFSAIINTKPAIGSEKPAPDLADNPFFGSFIVRRQEGGEAVNEAYDNADQIMQAHNSALQAARRTTTPEDAQTILANNPLASLNAAGVLRTLSNMRLAIDAVNHNNQMSDGEKLKAVDTLGTQMYHFADMFNQQVNNARDRSGQGLGSLPGAPKVVIRGATPVAPGQEPGTRSE